MGITRRTALGTIAAAGATFAWSARAAAGTSSGRDGSPRSFDVDAEERWLWELVDRTLDAAAVACALEPAVRSGPTRARLRPFLERAVASGAWERLKPLAAEYATTGATVAAIIAWSPETRSARIDEDAAALATQLVESNHRMVKLRVRQEQRARGIRI